MKEDTRHTIESELARARRAETEGNPGMVRVCCRRAAAAALQELNSLQPWRRYGTHALSLLEGLARDQSAGSDVRAAAGRLRNRVSPDRGSTGMATPLADLGIILAFIEAQLPSEPETR